MGAATDKVLARLAAGQAVKPAEYAAAKAEDEFTEMQAAIDAARIADETNATRNAAIEAEITDFAAEVDHASDYLEGALVEALTSLDKLDAARDMLERTVARHCHTLAHDLDYPMTYDEVMAKTNGRVTYQPVDSVAPKVPRTLAVGPHWIEWRHNRLAERDVDCVN